MGTYRAKPPVAAWIAQERRRKGWKAGDLAERLATIGVQVSEQTIRVWESNADRKPSPSNLDALERLFGGQAPERESPGDMADLVAALMAQTAAITELVSELREARGLSQEVRERVAAVEAYAEEHERRLQADLLRGIGPVADSPLRSPLPAGGR